MIVDRDFLLLGHIEKYSYATIHQIQTIFFKEQKYAYNIARRRLLNLKKLGYIKIYKDIQTNNNIYIFKNKEDNIKPPSLHRIIVLDCLAALHQLGAEVEYFKIERSWMDDKIRSDAFSIFSLADCRYRAFFEVQLSSHEHNLEKYQMLKESGEVQKVTGSDVFPRVVLVTERNYKNLNLKDLKVFTLDTKLNSFSKILL